MGKTAVFPISLISTIATFVETAVGVVIVQARDAVFIHVGIIASVCWNGLCSGLMFL